MSPELMAALRDKDWTEAEDVAELALPDEWREFDWSWMGERPEEARADPGLREWLPHVLVARRGKVPCIVGEAGFHGPPVGGESEIGYMVVADERRKGYATEAAGALIAWAGAEAGLERVRASVSPGNSASLGVLAKLGFDPAGRYIHPVRGEQLLYRRRII